jgi:protein TonB
MRLKTLSAGIVISLAIHAALLLCPPFSGDGSYAEVGKIEVGIVYLAAPSTSLSRQEELPLKLLQESGKPPSAPLSGDNKKQLGQARVKVEKPVKPLTKRKDPEPPRLQHSEPPTAKSDNSRRQSTETSPSQQVVATSEATPNISVSTTSPSGNGAFERLQDLAETAGPTNDAPSPIVLVEKITQSPRYHINPAPSYPSLALKRHWQGEVWLRVLVGERGEVIRASVENSSGHALLDDTALRTVRNWKFHPARQGEKNVRQEVRLPIRFELKRT